MDSSSGTIIDYIYIFEEKIIEFIMFFSNIIRDGSSLSTPRGTVAVLLTLCVAQVFSKSRDTPPFYLSPIMIDTDYMESSLGTFTYEM